MKKSEDKFTDRVVDRCLMFFVVFMSAVVPGIFAVAAGLLFFSNCVLGGFVCSICAISIYKPVTGFEMNRKITDDNELGEHVEDVTKDNFKSSSFDDKTGTNLTK